MPTADHIKYHWWVCRSSIHKS